VRNVQIGGHEWRRSHERRRISVPAMHRYVQWLWRERCHQGSYETLTAFGSQGDHMSLWKNRPKSSQSHFLSNSILNQYTVKK
jgi:hypothetical protein